MPRGDMAVLSDSAPVNGHRPSVDVLFHSVAQEFSLSTVGIFDDRAWAKTAPEGLGVIKAAGGFTIAQSEESCVVSGMPRAAITRATRTASSPSSRLAIFSLRNMEASASALPRIRKRSF